MKLRKDAVYDIVTVTSMGVRITPADRQPVHTGGLFELQSTSAETNVLNISASLGKSALALTRFVAGSPIARYLKGELRKRGIAFIGADIEPDGPWGVRHQFNIADSGYGARGPRVYNDRAGEVGRTITAADFDFEQIFKKDGCRILHLSGLIAAMSPETSQCCLEAARYAKRQGTLISFDLNYRASFWKGREEQLCAQFCEIASLSDVLIGNEEDFQLALDIAGPETGGGDIDQKIEGFKGMIDNARKAFPQVSVFATTLRDVVSANAHNWGAILYADGQWYTEPLREIAVYDRIGGGDGFVGGLLYGTLQGWPAQKWLQFAWATGALAVTLETDYATPVDEAQVWSIYEGNARVIR